MSGVQFQSRKHVPDHADRTAPAGDISYETLQIFLKYLDH